MSNNFYRHWLMLSKIPVRESGRGGIGSKELEEYLAREGFVVHQRTVQRDLVTFSKLFADLKSDGNRDMLGWYWQKDSQLLDLPAMPPEVALSFQLTQQFLDQAMPPSVKESLSPYFNRADQVLSVLQQANNTLSHWHEKIRFLPRNQALIPAEIKPEILSCVYKAVLEGKCIAVTYVNKEGNEKQYDLHPQAIVVRDSVIYMVATLWKYTDLMHFALHRLISCEISETDYRPLENFSLDDYIATGTFDYAQELSNTIKLTVYFEPSAGSHLLETPLSEDQKIVHKRDGRLEINATVNDSMQLRWWLLGFGDKVEVVKPKKLRDEFSKISQNMLALYLK